MISLTYFDVLFCPNGDRSMSLYHFVDGVGLRLLVISIAFAKEISSCPIPLPH
jgi:hypothetical protein